MLDQPAVIAALAAATEQLVERVRTSATQRAQWQESLDELLRERNSPTAPPPSDSPDAGTFGLAAIPVMQAAAAELTRTADAPPTDLANRIGPNAHPVERAIAAAAAHIEGRTARALVRDFDRAFLVARNGLLQRLAPPAPPAASSDDAAGQATATASPRTGLDPIVDLAERVLKEESGGQAALDRLLHDFASLTATLDDAEVRETAYAVLADLVLILLARLVRELVEEFGLIAASPRTMLRISGATARPAEPDSAAALRARIARQQMPPVEHLFRLVDHQGVRVAGSYRPSAPVIATLDRHQLVVFLHKHRKWVHAWWIAPDNRFRQGWIKAQYLKPLRNEPRP